MRHYCKCVYRWSVANFSLTSLNQLKPLPPWSPLTPPFLWLYTHLEESLHFPFLPHNICKKYSTMYTESTYMDQCIVDRGPVLSIADGAVNLVCVPFWLCTNFNKTQTDGWSILSHTEATYTRLVGQSRPTYLSVYCSVVSADQKFNFNCVLFMVYNVTCSSETTRQYTVDFNMDWVKIVRRNM